MRKYKTIQVLWVEDDPEVAENYPREAEMLAQIELHPFRCWKDAEKALEEDYSRWDAILLDAKCRYLPTDSDKADRFLMNAFRSIERIARAKSRTIPWYVLSGQGEDDIRDLIPVEIPWDADWEKIAKRRFYSKNGLVEIGNEKKQERHVLFGRIKRQVKQYNPELQIEEDLYPDVFQAMDNISYEFAGDVGFHLMPLLVPIHFAGTSNSDYNHRYIDLRKCLEHIFRHMEGKGILPECIISKDEKKGVNLSWSSIFLGGIQPEKPEEVAEKSERMFWSRIKRLTDAPLLPKQLVQWLKAAVFQTGGAVHTSEAEEEIAINLDKYLPNVEYSPYMLRSLTMGLCDFILWYRTFLKEVQEKGQNTKKFWILRK